VQESALTGEI